MNKLVSRIGILIFVLSSVSLSAQDIHFTQFYMSPLNLNPALTGVMNCKTRMVANYRNQWAAVLAANAYNTYSVSYDQKYLWVGKTTLVSEDHYGVM
ncbi:MAG: type IX secretion system membrane protein PorP/SprF [Saprospiraceae bacterium]|nr:type IX secretion system membrane protein PorP/SprF [Saprospiraceae bacterium]